MSARDKGLERRIECEKVAAVQEFIDRVLGILRAVGMPTDDCDGDEAPETILSGWIIANWMEASRRVNELEQDKCGLAADALNARQLLREFMAYVKCGQVPEDAHCARHTKQLLAANPLDARAREVGGVRAQLWEKDIRTFGLLVQHDSPKRITLMEPLSCKAPSLARPHCCYINTVVFYVWPYVIVHDRTGPWAGEKGIGNYLEWERVDTVLAWDERTVFEGQQYDVNGGRVVRWRKAWRMQRYARLHERPVRWAAGAGVCDGNGEPQSAAQGHSAAGQQRRTRDSMKTHKPIPRRSLHSLVRARWGAPYEDDGTCELCNTGGPTWMITSGADELPCCAACIVAAARSGGDELLAPRPVRPMGGQP